MFVPTGLGALVPHIHQLFQGVISEIRLSVLQC